MVLGTVMCVESSLSIIDAKNKDTSITVETIGHKAT